MRREESDGSENGRQGSFIIGIRTELKIADPNEGLWRVCCQDGSKMNGVSKVRGACDNNRLCGVWETSASPIRAQLDFQGHVKAKGNTVI